ARGWPDAKTIGLAAARVRGPPVDNRACSGKHERLRKQPWVLLPDDHLPPWVRYLAPGPHVPAHAKSDADTPQTLPVHGCATLLRPAPSCVLAHHPPSTWRPTASPPNVRTTCATIASPVGPPGWPRAMSPPSVLNGIRPPNAVAPSSTSRSPSPSAQKPSSS